MSKFPWKTTLAGTAILAATVYAFAAQLTPGPDGMHGPTGPSNQMPQPQNGMLGQMGGMHGQIMQHMHGGMGQPAAMNGQPFGAQNMPTMPGQDAFGTIQEIVQFSMPIPRPTGRRSISRPCASTLST